LIGLVAAVLALGSFECAPQSKVVANSQDGLFSVVLQPEGKLLIKKKGLAKPVVETIRAGYGHHIQIVLSFDASTIVLIDRYAGVEVLNRQGKQIAFFAPKDLLSKAEFENTPGNWACHTEGTWIDSPQVSIRPDRVKFKIYNGRQIEIPIPVSGLKKPLVRK
jgi:hypothetical protein